MDERELIKRWMKWKSDRDGVQYTFKAIAEEAGLNPNYLSNVMTGVRNPGRKTIAKIASALDITMSEFYSGPPATTGRRTPSRHSAAVVTDERADDDEASEPEYPPVRREEPDMGENSGRAAQGDMKEKFGLRLGGGANSDFDKLFSTLGFESADMFLSEPQTAFPREVNDIESCDTGIEVKPDAEEDQAAASGSSRRPGTSGGVEAAPGASVRPRHASKFIPLFEDCLSGDVLRCIDNYYDRGRSGFKSIPRFFGVSGEHVFAMYVRDKSMYPDLDAGDLLIVNPDVPFKNTNGGIGVVHDGEQFKIRRIFIKSGNYLLVPSNSMFEPEIAAKDAVKILKVAQWIPRAENKF